jgi:HlyD family secretion protein
MKRIVLPILMISLLTSCGKESDQADAYGNFEATEVIVSAETNGKILDFPVTEGSVIEKNSEMALIDTLLLQLQKNEIETGKKSILTRITSINAQNGILEQQIKNLDVNIDRFEKMLKDDAATQKQLDDITGQKTVLQKQIEANNTQRASVAAELSIADSKESLIDEQIKRAMVKSPINGTIVEKYSEAGEITTAGKPLAKIADMSVVKLKVYVSGAQLGKVKTGESCTVRIDDGVQAYRSFIGTISHVSEKAEFTPKIIQTKDERVTLVYAVTIDVKNDGSLKSGMPGEALFTNSIK